MNDSTLEFAHAVQRKSHFDIEYARIGAPTAIPDPAQCLVDPCLARN
ncbi:hypothetical protein R75471_05099 [Paraburkholderia domus]|nr:hypothetical protein R75483_04373 [Paraburkholderia domus]CAE6936760.1 hypothetical protein R75471_05099 [Paraburkholderia domus]